MPVLVIVAILVLFLLSMVTANSLALTRVHAQSPTTVTGVGPWTEQNDYGSNSTAVGTGGILIQGTSCVTYLDYAYCVGGQDLAKISNPDISNVYFAPLSSTGSVGAWVETTDYGASTGNTGSGGIGIEWPSCVEYDGYVYCVGGSTNSGIISKTFYAQLSSSGVGSWTETTDYGAASGTSGAGGLPLFQIACVADSGYIYCTGGGPSKVFYAPLSSSGIGAWSETTDYGAASGNAGTGGVPIDSDACVGSGGYIYCIGGTTTSYKVISDVFYAQLSSTGVGAWTETTDYGATSGSSGTGGEPIFGTNCISYSSYVICMSGDTTGGAAAPHVFYGQDQGIDEWDEAEDFEGGYWFSCIQVYWYIFCWGDGSAYGYSAPIQPVTETTTTPAPVSSTTGVSVSSTTTELPSTTTIETSSQSTASTSTTGETSSSTTPATARLATILLPLQTEVNSGAAQDTAFFVMNPVTAPGPTGGTVTYYRYSGTNCSGGQTEISSVNVRTSGTIPPTPFMNFTSPGNYYFSASFSGYGSFPPMDSLCEKLIVVPASGTTTTPITNQSVITTPVTTVAVVTTGKTSSLFSNLFTYVALLVILAGILGSVFFLRGRGSGSGSGGPKTGGGGSPPWLKPSGSGQQLMIEEPPSHYYKGPCSELMDQYETAGRAYDDVLTQIAYGEAELEQSTDPGSKGVTQQWMKNLRSQKQALGNVYQQIENNLTDCWKKNNLNMSDLNNFLNWEDEDIPPPPPPMNSSNMAAPTSPPSSQISTPVSPANYEVQSPSSQPAAASSSPKTPMPDYPRKEGTDFVDSLLYGLTFGEIPYYKFEADPMTGPDVLHSVIDSLGPTLPRVETSTPSTNVNPTEQVM